ncbi:MAG: type II toxin-antitoxin system RelE/ParE family toxin [Marinobacter sp.]
MHPLWKVEFSQKASSDFDDIILHTAENFGRHQAESYSRLIANCIKELSEYGPLHPLARNRPELIASVQSMRIQRQGQRAKHIVFFTVTAPTTRKILILRLLHESMDFGEHL